MFNKKQYRILLISAMAVFFIIAFLIYMSYTREKIKLKPFNLEKPVEEVEHIEQEDGDKPVMSQDVVKIKPGTDVVFEIVDQLGLTTQKENYKGMNWLDYTKPQLAKEFPEYLITNYEEDQVTLTKVIEREIEPNYILTTENGHIVISIDKNGHKIFYKKTGLEQHDLSDTLSLALEKGIPITVQQKDDILDNSDEVYMILQEYDE